MHKALAPQISTWPDENPQLIGSSCGECDATVFPEHLLCPRCSSDQVSTALLPRRGTLIAWTTQGFLPGPPYAGRETSKTFTPFNVGLVQLGDVVRVEGRLTETDPAALRFGIDVELTMIPFTSDDEGNDIVTFAFRAV